VQSLIEFFLCFGQWKEAVLMYVFFSEFLHLFVRIVFLMEIFDECSVSVGIIASNAHYCTALYSTESIQWKSNEEL